MVFFHIEEDANSYTTRFAINSYWWLYLAVTIPLTVVVGLAWYWMLNRKGYHKLKAPEIDTTDIEMNSSSNQPTPEESKSK
jgi:hypothetical protein